MTFSLLPDFLCAGLPGTLVDVEAVVATAETGTREAVSEALRPKAARMRSGGLIRPAPAWRA